MALGGFKKFLAFLVLFFILKLYFVFCFKKIFSHFLVLFFILKLYFVFCFKKIFSHFLVLFFILKLYFVFCFKKIFSHFLLFFLIFYLWVLVRSICTSMHILRIKNGFSKILSNSFLKSIWVSVYEFCEQYAPQCIYFASKMIFS